VVVGDEVTLLVGTNPEPVAPPSWPSNSAEIWTVLGSSSCATAAIVPPPLSGGSETVSTPSSPSSTVPGLSLASSLRFS
jgi:hypothetical protein